MAKKTTKDKGTFGQEDDDSNLLAKLGYHQVFERGMGSFGSFAVSFTIISVLAGCLTSYYIAFSHGGPAIVVWGWLLVGVMVTVVGFALAEIASSMPTAGSMYYWASKLGSPTWGWFTGWLNLAGVVAVTAAIDMGAAIFWSSLLNIWFGFPVTNLSTFLVFTVILGSHLLLNLKKVRLLGIMNSISAVWHIVGVLVILAVLVIVPDHHQSASFVFTETLNLSGFSGENFSEPGFWFVAALGLLMAQYTITGFGASAHLAEETNTAARKSAIGIVSSIIVSVIFGFILLVAITFAIPENIQGVIDAGDQAVPYIWQTALGDAWGSTLLFIACVAQYFCGNAALASGSRMLFAFSRDGAVPGRKIWRKISPRNHVPANAVLLTAFITWLLMIPTIANGTIGYEVGTSVAVIGLFVSFVIPIFLRWRAGDNFERGPWTIGKHYRWVDPIAIGWVAVVTVLFLFPLTTGGVWFTEDFTWTAANYAPLTFGGLMVIVGIWWMLSARKWFKGPQSEVDEELLLTERSDLDESILEKNQELSD